MKGQLTFRTYFSIVFLYFLFGYTADLTAFEQKNQTKKLSIPGHGALVFEIPRTWKTDINKSDQSAFPTIEIEPKKGGEFKIMITPMWDMKGDDRFNDLERIKSLVETDAKDLLSRAVENKIPLQEISGAVSEGYYFTATDGKPEPGGYPFLIQARVGTGKLLLKTTILYRNKRSTAIKSALSMLQTAGHVNAENGLISKLCFKGQNITDAVTGITINAEGNEMMVLLNPNDHYVLILPFGKDWRFWVEEKKGLQGTSGLFNLTLEITDSGLSPEKHLKKLKSHLMSKGNSVPVSKAEWIEVRDQTVLRTEVDAGKIDPVFKGVKHVNFYYSKKWQRTLYNLHYSKVVSPKKEDGLEDEKILDLITVGFHVDYER